MRHRVVITGIGCIGPLGADAETFWQRAAQGHSGIGPIRRFDAATFDVQLAGEVSAAPQIPPALRAEADADPKIGFALHAALQAMQSAGYSGFDRRWLVHLGTSLEYFDARKVVGGGRSDLGGFVARSLGAGAPPLQVPLDSAGDCLARHFGRPGLVLTNVSACAASTQAIGHAFRRVRDGTWEIALVGGFDSMVNPFGIGGFQRLGALTTDRTAGERACRPFDVLRSGTVLGEGAACLVLEPLQRARQAGRFCYAEVLGYGSSLDARKVSAPDPEGRGALAAMRGALEDAGLDAARVDAVSAHATGTILNDEVEAQAIRSLLGPRFEEVPVVATKALTGHLIGAAGALEVVAALQGFLQNRLHPNPSLGVVAPGCELCHVVDSPRVFQGEYLLKNSFGFGGQNASLVMGRIDGGQ